MLGLSISALVSTTEPEDASEHQAACASARSAFKAYVFLLAWLLRQAEAEEKAAAAASADAAPGGSRAILPSRHCS